MIQNGERLSVGFLPSRRRGGFLWHEPFNYPAGSLDTGAGGKWTTTPGQVSWSVNGTAAFTFAIPVGKFNSNRDTVDVTALDINKNWRLDLLVLFNNFLPRQQFLTFTFGGGDYTLAFQTPFGVGNSVSVSLDTPTDTNSDSYNTVYGVADSITITFDQVNQLVHLFINGAELFGGPLGTTATVSLFFDMVWSSDGAVIDNDHTRVLDIKWVGTKL